MKRELPFKHAPDFSAADVRIIREETGLTVEEFAIAIGANYQSVRAWEKGGLKTGSARRVLELIWENPDRWKAIYVDEPEPIRVEVASSEAAHPISPHAKLGSMPLAEAIAMYQSGKTLQDVADVARLSRERVRQVLTSYGIRRTNFQIAKIVSSRREVSKDDLLVAIDDGHTSEYAIARHLRRSIVCVKRSLVKYGIVLLPPFDPVKEALNAEIVRRYESGERIVSIAIAVGVSPSYVHRYLVKIGKHKSRHTPRVRRYKKYPQSMIDEIIRMRSQEHLTQKEIGRRFNIDQSSVHNVLVRNGYAVARSRPSRSRLVGINGSIGLHVEAGIQAKEIPNEELDRIDSVGPDRVGSDGGQSEAAM